MSTSDLDRGPAAPLVLASRAEAAGKMIVVLLADTGERYITTRGEVLCRVSDDIEAELWAKLIMNCAYNAISALSRASTAQDIARGKRTEIDSLNGYVARRGAELGIPTPVNQTLHGLVNLLEESLNPR